MDREQVPDSILRLLDSVDTHVSAASSSALQANLDPSKLDSIESKLFVLTKKVQTWKNSTLMINQLPPEVLADVFDFCRKDKLPSVFAVNEPPDLSLLTITSVCRHWRDIALEFPTLWTHVDTAHTTSATLALERSGAAALSVAIRQPWAGFHGSKGEMAEWFPQVLSAHSSRLEELHVQSDPMNPDDFVTVGGYFENPAPNLRRLSFLAYWSSHGRLPIIFGGAFPKLERLVLEGIHHWSGNNFKDLTHLTLSGQSFDRSLTNELPGVLQASPTLIELFLSFRKSPILTTPRIPNHIPTSRIVLNHLRTLYIYAGYASQLVPLMSRLVIPPGVKIYIRDTHIRFDRPQEFQKLISDDCGGLHNFSKLRVEFNESTSLTFSGMSGPTLFSFHLQWNATRGQLAESLDFLFARVSSSPIEALLLKRFDSLNLEGLDWPATFRTMSSLEQLTIIGEDYVSDEILAGLLPYTNARGEVGVPCPDLAVLVVLCPHLKGRPIPSLASAITRRRANYCSVQTLRLSQGYLGITVDDMAQLRNNVSMEMVTDANYIASTEFEEISEFKDIWPPKW